MRCIGISIPPYPLQHIVCSTHSSQRRGVVSAVNETFTIGIVLSSGRDTVKRTLFICCNENSGVSCSSPFAPTFELIRVQRNHLLIDDLFQFLFVCSGKSC